MNNFKLTKDSHGPLEHPVLTFNEDATIADVLAYLHHHDDEDDLFIATVRGAAEEIGAFSILLDFDQGSAWAVSGALRRIEARLNTAVALAKRMSLEASVDDGSSDQFPARVAS